MKVTQCYRLRFLQNRLLPWRLGWREELSLAARSFVKLTRRLQNLHRTEFCSIQLLFPAISGDMKCLTGETDVVISPVWNSSDTLYWN